MSHQTDSEDTNPLRSTQQDIEGDGNQIIGEAIESTIYHISDTEHITINQTHSQPSRIESIKSQPLIQRSPYLGLRKFEVRDKDLFFGRDQLINRLLDRLEEAPFLLILGASGSGKSSLIRAGLIPKLGIMLGSGFRELIFTPDRDPFDSFRSSLRSTGFRQSDLESLQTGKPETIVQVARSLKSDDEDWLIFIDQFEELFTLCLSLPKQQAFIKGLFQLIQAELPGVRLVAAMRADFLDRLGAYPQLTGVLQWAELITDMGNDELRLAIEKPAAHHGVVLEPELMEEIVHDLKGRPDTVSEAERVSLPLLQYTLKLLWESGGDLSVNRTLRVSTYRALGGVRGALQRHVDEIYAPLPDEQKQAAKHIFLQLVDVTSADAGATAVGKAVSRRAALNEFSPTEQVVLRQLVDAGLLVSDDPDFKTGSAPIEGPAINNRKATVELAHETLIDAWDTLKAWIEESRPLMRLRNQLRDDAHSWYEIYLDNQVKAEAELWQGSRLDGLRSHRQEMIDRFGNFKAKELEFIKACEELCDRTRRREVRRLRQTIAWVSGFLALSSGLAVFAGYQWLRVRQAQIRAQSQAAQAQFALNPNTVDSLLEALQAGKAYSWTPKLFGTSRLKPDVMEALAQSVYWVREQNRLEGHSNIVRSVSFSPDGTILATGSDDRTVRLWSRDGQLLLDPLEGHTGAVLDVSISPDGTKVASVSYDRTLKLWDIESGQLLQNISFAHNDGIYSVTFNPTGTLLATTSEDQTIQLWTVQNNTLQKSPVAPFSGHTSLVRAAAFSPNGQILVSGSDDGQLILWNLQGVRLREPITAYSNGVVTAIDFNKDSTFATAGEENGRGSIKLWDSAGNLIRQFADNQDGLRSVQFNPDGESLAATDGNGNIHVWYLDGRKLASLHNKTSSSINSLSFGSNKLIAVGDSDNSVEFWNIESSLINLMQGHTDAIQGVAIHPNDGKIATAGEDKTVRLWSPQGEQIWVASHAHQITRVAFHPQQNVVIGGDAEGEIHFWNSETGEIARPSLSAHKGMILSLDLDLTNQVMVTSSADKTAKLWKLNDLTAPIVLNHEDAVYSVSLNSRDMLATGSADGTIRFWDMAGRSLNTSIQNDVAVSAIAFSPKENLLALGDSNGSVKLWDEISKQLREIGKHEAAIWGVSFSPDGEVIATASNDSTIKLWQADGTFLMTLRGHNGNVNSISFHPNNPRILVSGGQDGRSIQWIIEPTLQELLSTGCKQLEHYLGTHSKDPDIPQGLCE